jgi:O-antigen ligase
VISVPRFIVIGTVMPLAALLLGRFAFTRDAAIRTFLLALMVFAAYSALVSVLSFSAPSLVWPRYVVTHTSWPERAVGVFNQPVVNGLVLVLGFLAALLVASHRVERPIVRFLAVLLAPACLYGVYLTHTRSALLGLFVTLVLGMLVARGWRSGFVITLTVSVFAVALNWSTFSSSDRKSGGVGSPGEVYDRLNMIATGSWALAQKPLAGWGIARFPSVNTYHHKQWSPNIPWDFGYGLASHTDLVGIGAELGLIGVLLWLLLFSLILIRLVRAIRTLPEGGQFDRDFAVFALLGVVCLLVTGLTVDLRYFDFPNIVVLLFAGAAIGRAEAADALVGKRR